MKQNLLSTPFFIILFTYVILTSCSKQEPPQPEPEPEPEPSLAEQIAGNYTVTRFVFTELGYEISLPFKDPSTNITFTGKVEIKKVKDATISAIFTEIETDIAGKTSSTLNDWGELTLKKIATGEIEVYKENSKIGVYNKGELKITDKEEGTGEITLVAKK